MSFSGPVGGNFLGGMPPEFLMQLQALGAGAGPEKLQALEMGGGTPPAGGMTPEMEQAIVAALGAGAAGLAMGRRPPVMPPGAGGLPVAGSAGRGMEFKTPGSFLPGGRGR